jgi:hypothetical protein
MTSKVVHNQTFTGGASVGYLKPFQLVNRESSGGDTSRALRKMGIFSENPYRFTGEFETQRAVTLLDRFGDLKQSSTSTFNCDPVWDDVNYPPFSDVTPKLLEGWRASSFDLGVAIGEGKESAEMIIGRLTDIAKAASALRKRNLGGALRHLSHVPRRNRRNAAALLGDSTNLLSSVWLELQYGWIPLIKDIGAAAEMIKLKPTSSRVKARSSNRGGAHPATGFLPPSRLQLFNNDRRLQQVVIVSNNPTFIERLGLTDPQSIVWELTPFSFVVDWFSPIGDYFKTLHAVNTMPVTSVIQTYSSKKSCIIRVLPGDKNISSQTCLSGGAASHNSVIMDRSIYPTMPLAWLASTQVPNYIRESWDPSVKRMANAVALTQQVLRGLSH